MFPGSKKTLDIPHSNLVNLRATLGQMGRKYGEVGGGKNSGISPQALSEMLKRRQP